MHWKKFSNFIIAIILTIAFTITTLLNVIGPLHIDATGKIYEPGPILIYSIIYYIVSLFILWGTYFYFKKKHELLFFTLIILGIVIIIGENFIWAKLGT
ncbi:MAG: hypothetical protein ACD_46C00456G0004 [uncultured bacterium]|nr:MAG: hypothetical protein ACD_46C00456G0004 [uncultured bacterium]